MLLRERLSNLSTQYFMLYLKCVMITLQLELNLLARRLL